MSIPPEQNENRKRATQLCQKRISFARTKCVAKLNFTQKIQQQSHFHFSKIQFRIGEKNFTKAKLKFVHAILIFILSKCNSTLAKLTGKGIELASSICRRVSPARCPPCSINDQLNLLFPAL